MKDQLVFCLLLCVFSLSCNLEKIELANGASIACFTYKRLDISCSGDCLVQFTNCSINADAYLWDFGCGSPTTSEERNPPDHAFPVGNDCTVTLRIFRNGVLVDDTSLVIRILAPQEVFAASLNDVGSFGYCVDISGDYAIVGAHTTKVNGTNSSQGEAFLYHFDGSSWKLQDGLFAPSPVNVANSSFGNSVAVNGNIALVGVPSYDGVDNANTGAACLYSYVGGSDPWGMGQLMSFGEKANDYFGRSVDVAGNDAIVGSFHAGTNQNGAVYLYHYVPNTWSLDTILRNPNDTSTTGEFGYCSLISAQYVIVGAPYDNENGIDRGAVYIYEKEGGRWKMMPPIVGENAGDKLGTAIALHGDELLIGASGADKAYLYKRGVSGWQKNMTLMSNVSGELYGASVALSAQYIVVGAPDSQVNGKAAQGVIYVYDRTQAIHEPNRIQDLNGEAGARFGRSVALDGKNLIVGAYQADIGGNIDEGKVIFYHLD